MAIYRHSPFSLSELELFCNEELAKMSVSRCVQLLETDLAGLNAPKGCSKSVDSAGA